MPKSTNRATVSTTIPAKPIPKLPNDSVKAVSQKPLTVDVAPAVPPPIPESADSPLADDKETATKPAFPTSLQPSDGLLVVGDAVSDGQFSTLQAACAAAKNGDIIELRFNGRRMESPFRIANTKLTIRAADGFAPVISFAPVDAALAKSSPAMLTVNGGSLSLINVAVEFAVPRDIGIAGWTLIEVRRPELVRFERTSLTIQNAADGGRAFQPNVVFIAIASNDGSANVGASAKTATAARAPVVIELQNCIARGEATFLRVAGGESARILWDNGLLATSERLLVAESSSTSPIRSRVELDVRHLTAVVRGGLAWLDFRTNGMDGMLADLRLAGSIVHVGDAAAMIVQLDPATSLDLEGTLSWSGDRNFYEGVETFWKRTPATEPDSGQQLALANWQSYWGKSRETLPYLNAVVWQKAPPVDLPICRQVPADYALSTTSAINPARDSASDGLDAGCLSYLLPALPAP